jgi:hypothetical protein
MIHVEDLQTGDDDTRLDHIVGVVLEPDYRVLVGHPGVERVLQEQVAIGRPDSCAERVVMPSRRRDARRSAVIAVLGSRMVTVREREEAVGSAVAHAPRPGNS